LKTGDIVKISKSKGIFEKGYKFNWSEELFKIKKKISSDPVTYCLEDMAGEEIKGSFYNEELSKIPNYARIEKVLNKKSINGLTYLRVKWKGYDNRFNSWV
ncbi:Chromo domain-like, partial [Trinorchestia longiramus]